MGPLADGDRAAVIQGWLWRSDHLPTLEALLKAPGEIPANLLPDMVVGLAKSMNEHNDTLTLMLKYCPPTTEMVGRALTAALEGPPYSGCEPLVRQRVEQMLEFARLHGITLSKAVRQELFRTAVSRHSFIDFAHLFYDPTFDQAFLLDMLTWHITYSENMELFTRVYQDIKGLTRASWYAIQERNQRAIEIKRQSIPYGSEYQWRYWEEFQKMEKRANEQIAIHYKMTEFLLAHKPQE